MEYSFREPKDIAELEALLEMRQSVYTNDKELSSMVDHSKSFDVDAYDLCAWHFGAFHQGIPVAYIRLTAKERTEYAESLLKLANQHNISIATKEFDFPFQQYYPDAKWSAAFLEKLYGRRIGEVGKLAIQEDHRNGNKLLFHFISSFLSYCTDQHRIQTGFGSCTPALERFYRKFGFYQPYGTRSFVYKDLPEAVLLRYDPEYN